MSIFNKRKPYRHFVFGGAFLVDFYRDEKDIKGCYADITTVSDNFSLKVTGYPYGYLLASAEADNLDNIHGFCAMMYLIADGVYQDAGLANDLMKVIGKYQKRLLKRAESEAKAVKDHEEAASQALMEDIASEQGMSKKELKAKRKADKAALREVLNEKKGE